MKSFFGLGILVFINCSCHFDVQVTKNYQLYFDDTTYQIMQKGVDASEKEEYVLADSLLTIVINNSNSKLSNNMPQEFNPYFYRGNNYLNIGKYNEAISDMKHVASDTTTNTSVLLVRMASFQMLEKYDTSIALTNIFLKEVKSRKDSIVGLSERGISFFEKGDFNNACSDLNQAVKMGMDTTDMEQYLTKCK